MPPTKQDDETAKEAMTPDFLKGVDISPEEEKQMEDAAYSGAADDIAEREGLTGEAPTSRKLKAEKEELDKLGSGYREEDEKPGRLKSLKSRFGKASKRKQYAIIASIISGLGTLGAVIVLLFNLVGIFKLDHFLDNIESKAFIRYQVDMEGRSSKWINAYIQLRLMDIEDPLHPNDPDNIMFRSNRVDTNNPTTDWYKTMRASKFESDLAEKYGMKFTSVAYRDGNMIKFRPGIVTIKDEQITFANDLKPAELSAIENFDPNGLNGRLSEFVDTKVFDSNKQGRKELKRVIRENTKAWQFAKRYYLRKSIQNMTGIRDWRFFENTREKLGEKNISIRNKIIAKALPESTKSGKIFQCLFGVVQCKSQPDPNDPENHASVPANGEVCDSSKPECSGKDGDGNPDTKDSVPNDGSATKDIADAAIELDPATDAQLKIVRKIASTLTKASGPAAIVSLVDTLDKVDTSIKSGALVTTIYMAKATQDIGLYTAYGIARDQIHTGEVNTAEVNEMMQMLDGAGTSEGFDTIVAGNNSRSKVSAEAMQQAQSKKEYCSEEHQAAMLLPQNKAVAESEYHYLCPQEKIGGPNRAQTIQDGWNGSVGALLQPLLAPYRHSGPLKDLVGAFNSAVDAVFGSIMNGAFKALGVADNMNDFVGWIVGKTASFLGAVPTFQTASPTGVYSNHVLTGAAASSEFAMRFTGGAATTAATKADAETRVADYINEENHSQSMYTKYASTSNPNSVFSRGLFAVSTRSIGSSISRYVGSIFSAPFNATSTTKAETRTGYEAAQFAGVDTYDLPRQCTDSDPVESMYNGSLAKQTNADDLGLIPPSELTWDLLQDSNAFYARLYELHPDSKDINNVYDCAVLDSTARGSVAGQYAPNKAGPNAISNSGGAASASEQGGGSSFRISSFNIFYANGGGSNGGDWSARLDKSVGVINDKRLDVVGLQEVQEVQWQALQKRLGGTYAIYPKKYTPDPGANSIIWRNDKFDLVRGEAIPARGVHNQPSTTSQVLLRDKSTDQQFYVINTHEPVGNGPPDGDGGRYQNDLRWKAYIDNLQSENIPIFFTGDFNAAYGEGFNNNFKDNDKNNGIYCILTADKTMWDSYDASKNISGKCPTDGFKDLRGGDHIFMSRGVTASSHIRTGYGFTVNGSDTHQTIISDVTIPGSGSTSSTADDGSLAACYTVTKLVGRKIEGKMFHKDDGTHSGTGVKTYAMENSPEGVKIAAREGYDSIDLDWQITKDGVPVNTHWGQPMAKDGFYDPLHQLPENTQVNDMTLEEITRLRNKDGQSQIHSLEDMAKVLAQYNMNLSMEFKTGALTAKLPYITGILNQYQIKAYIKGDASKPALNKALTAARNFGYWTRGTLGSQGWKAPGPNCVGGNI